MTHGEFKEILESIDVGLYNKWFNNFIKSNPNVSLILWISLAPEDNISGSFLYNKTTESVGYFNTMQVDVAKPSIEKIILKLAPKN